MEYAEQFVGVDDIQFYRCRSAAWIFEAWEGAENGYWVIEGERRLLDHDIRNVYTDLQLWYDSAWNKHVL